MDRGQWREKREKADSNQQLAAFFRAHASVTIFRFVIFPIVTYGSAMAKAQTFSTSRTRPRTLQREKLSVVGYVTSTNKQSDANWKK